MRVESSEGVDDSKSGSHVVGCSMNGSQRQKNPEHVFTEEDWNDSTTISYAYSKVNYRKILPVGILFSCRLNSTYMEFQTAAEKAAWEFAKANDMNLVVINPAFVLGPVYSTEQTNSTSVKHLLKFFDRSLQGKKTS